MGGPEAEPPAVSKSAAPRGTRLRRRQTDRLPPAGLSPSAGRPLLRAASGSGRMQAPSRGLTSRRGPDPEGALAPQVSAPGLPAAWIAGAPGAQRLGGMRPRAPLSALRPVGLKNTAPHPQRPPHPQRASGVSGQPRPLLASRSLGHLQIGFKCHCTLKMLFLCMLGKNYT